jgi:hypothetical protein
VQPFSKTAPKGVTIGASGDEARRFTTFLQLAVK